jgi:hypothetical protein
MKEIIKWIKKQWNRPSRFELEYEELEKEINKEYCEMEKIFKGTGVVIISYGIRGFRCSYNGNVFKIYSLNEAKKYAKSLQNN